MARRKMPRRRRDDVAAPGRERPDDEWLARWTGRFMRIPWLAGEHRPLGRKDAERAARDLWDHFRGAR